MITLLFQIIDIYITNYKLVNLCLKILYNLIINLLGNSYLNISNENNIIWKNIVECKYELIKQNNLKSITIDYNDIDIYDLKISLIKYFFFKPLLLDNEYIHNLLVKLFEYKYDNNFNSNYFKYCIINVLIVYIAFLSNTKIGYLNIVDLKLTDLNYLKEFIIEILICNFNNYKFFYDKNEYNTNNLLEIIENKYIDNQFEDKLKLKVLRLVYDYSHIYNKLNEYQKNNLLEENNEPKNELSFKLRNFTEELSLLLYNAIELLYKELFSNKYLSENKNNDIDLIELITVNTKTPVYFESSLLKDVNFFKNSDNKHLLRDFVCMYHNPKNNNNFISMNNIEFLIEIVQDISQHLDIYSILKDRIIITNFIKDTSSSYFKSITIYKSLVDSNIDKINLDFYSVSNSNNNNNNNLNDITNYISHDKLLFYHMDFYKEIINSRICINDIYYKRLSLQSNNLLVIFGNSISNIENFIDLKTYVDSECIVCFLISLNGKDISYYGWILSNIIHEKNTEFLMILLNNEYFYNSIYNVFTKSDSSIRRDLYFYLPTLVNVLLMNSLEIEANNTIKNLNSNKYFNLILMNDNYFYIMLIKAIKQETSCLNLDYISDLLMSLINFYNNFNYEILDETNKKNSDNNNITIENNLNNALLIKQQVIEKFCCYLEDILNTISKITKYSNIEVKGKIKLINHWYNSLVCDDI